MVSGTRRPAGRVDATSAPLNQNRFQVRPMPSFYLQTHGQDLPQGPGTNKKGVMRETIAVSVWV